MNEFARIVVKPNPSINADEARDARARAWRYVFDCYERKIAAGPSASGEDAEGGSKHDSSARPSIHNN